MCDDCLSHPQPFIGRLCGQHESILRLVRDAELALARGDLVIAHARVQAVLDDLGPHCALEEAALFPVLSGDALFASTVGALHHDHEAAHTRHAGDPTAEGWVHDAIMLLANVREHIRREEADLFPAAVHMLSTASWDEIERRAATGIQPA